MSEKVDVVLLTKNSLQPCLKECIDSVYAHLPVGRLLVVDGGSTDGTVDFVKSYSNVEVIDDTYGNRATARQKGIEAVQTTWHLHLDSDVILCKGWWGAAQKFLQPDVGALWGVTIVGNKHIYNISKSMAMLHRKDTLDYIIAQQHLKRYATHDTLIRTEVVRDIHIPADLHIWEDHYIGQHIVAKNFKWLNTREPCCIHYFHDRRGFEDFVNSGRLARRLHSYSSRQVLLRLGLAVPKALWIILATGDFKAAKLQLENYIGLAKGWYGST
ncbi:MAG: glycosyltransferase family 2 protein [Nitrososphaerota archaeon]|nr:glycosyltransferase family 2 protein [Nitrososphaerota archaeon]